VIATGAAPDDVLPTLARVVASGAVSDARGEARRLAAVARDELDAVSASVDHDALREAVTMAVERSS
jgi:geranylgeranyl pyrophosphate synthase